MILRKFLIVCNFSILSISCSLTLFLGTIFAFDSSKLIFPFKTIAECTYYELEYPSCRNMVNGQEFFEKIMVDCGSYDMNDPVSCKNKVEAMEECKFPKKFGFTYDRSGRSARSRTRMRSAIYDLMARRYDYFPDGSCKGTFDVYRFKKAPHSFCGPLQENKSKPISKPCPKE
jgi:hypothetical protein